MSTVIDSTYFKGQPAYIPDGVTLNVAAPGEQAENLSSTDRLIALYEPILLRGAVGTEYYEGITEALEMQPYTPGSPDTAEAEYQKLISGYDYDLDGVRYNWPGLKGGASKDSLIMYFIHCKYLQLSSETVYSRRHRKASS